MTLKICMQHRVLDYFQVCSNDDPELTLTYFTATISETIVVCDIEVGRFSLLNEYINHYEYQKSRSFMELRPRSLRFNIFNLVLLRNR